MQDNAVEPQPKKLLEWVRDAVRVKHYSYETEKTYVQWIRRYILFHNKRHPSEMGGDEVNAFLTHLAVNQNVAASTQNQALCAILFLYREVLQQELDLRLDAVRAKLPHYLPTVLTVDEVQSVLCQVSGIYQIVAKLLYGSGLRLNEALQLRVKDLDFAQQQIVIRNSKGMESRVTMACQFNSAIARAFAESQAHTPKRSSARIWICLLTVCPRAKIP
jgi:site-specific recombinase XerD